MDYIICPFINFMLDFIFCETYSVQSTTILPHESGETIAVNQECSFSSRRDLRPRGPGPRLSRPVSDQCYE